MGGGGGTITFSAANTFTGANALVVGGLGTVVVSESNDFTGATTIAAGSNLQLTAAGALPGTSGVANAGTLTFNRADASSFSGVLSGPGTLALRGAGTVTLTGASGSQGGLDVQSSGTKTLVSDGLTLNGSAGGNVLIVGNLTPDGSTSTLNLTPTGGAGTGSFTINSPSADIVVGQNGANNANTPVPTASLSLADYASFTATINDLRIATTGKSIGQVTLARGTNTITADNIFLATQTTTGTTGSFISLGQTNTINSDVIVVGGGRTAGNLFFQADLSGTPTVVIRGKGGAGTLADLLVGDQVNSRSGGANGGSGDPLSTVDFTLGSVSANLDELIVGTGTTEISGNIGAARGLLRFDEGTISAATTVLGRATNATTGTSVNDSAQGTLEVSGSGAFSTGTLTLGQNTDATGASTPGAVGILNVSGGTVAVSGDIIAATHTSTSGNGGTANPTSATLNLTGGITTVQGNITEGVGTQPKTSTINLSGGTLDVTGGNVFVDAINAEAGTLRNVGQLGSSAGVAVDLTKTTAGVLIMAGANTYTGATNVNAGTLLVNGSITSSVTVSNASSTLGGGGVITGDVALGAGTVLAPGNSPGVLTVSGTTAFADATFSLEINGTVAGLDFDQLATGGLSITGQSNILLTLGYAAALNEQFVIINNTSASTIAGTFFNLAQGDELEASFGGATYSLVADYAGGTGNDLVLTVSAVPEPATAGTLLAGLTLLAGTARRRRLHT